MTHARSPAGAFLTRRRSFHSLFAKNVQENVNRVQLEDAAELDGSRKVIIRNHPSDAEGVITLTTDYPDMSR